jgi:hypothetical protein
MQPLKGRELFWRIALDCQKRNQAEQKRGVNPKRERTFSIEHMDEG